MSDTISMTKLIAFAFCAAMALASLIACADSGFADVPPQQEAQHLAALPTVTEPPGNHPPIDHSGRRQAGKASFYGQRRAGRRMANGRRFNPLANTAASKSLPLGTVAKVTNLDNGKSALVTVEDRGPYVNGRVVDLTSSTAGQLGITEEKGVAPVVVAPVAVPQFNGEVKAGAGAVDVPPATAAQSLVDAKESARHSGQDPER
jgi:rare lipoprotein A